MRYEMPGSFTRVFHRAGFRRRSLRALGLLTPPPYLEAFARRHEGLVRRLDALDAHVGAWPGLRALGDHFLIVLQKV
jgi:hypothetical protein